MDLSLTLFDGLLIFGGIVFVLYLYGTSTFKYFAKKNIPFDKPIPFIGNMKKTLLRTDNPIIMMQETYNAYSGKRVIGTFEFRTPVFMVRDPELIRQIGVKDFDHFVDHRPLIDSSLDPMWGNGLISLRGQKWRDMRATLSPAFTGSKMKAMYSLVSDCAVQLANYLVKESKKGPLEIEMKSLFTKYTNDVIATAAFGIKVDSLNEPENKFYLMGKKITDFTNALTSMKFFCLILIPKIMKMFNATFLDKEASVFMRQLVLETMDIRQKENIIRPDMIHLLIQARKGTLTHEVQTDAQDAGFATVEESTVGKQITKREWTDNELAAQAVLFFLAGFDTTSTLLSFAAHELAANPEIQETLLAEIDDAKDLGTPTYESIQKLQYLDMVISEVLRKWPPGAALDRFCIKPYVVTDLDGNPEFTVEEGKVMVIPTFAIHHDPEYYPDPDRFDPERFSEENKKNIKPFTYMPFGVGPRNCIGSRFALMETKAVLFHILSEFTFEVGAKTMIPLQLTKKGFLMQPDNGFWVQLKPRINKG